MSTAAVPMAAAAGALRAARDRPADRQLWSEAGTGYNPARDDREEMARLLLAPMEGLLDDVLRDVLTRVGGYDLAVSEFIRVSGNLLPQRSFVRVCPELARASRTRAGTPLVVQLLGSDPICLAENAAQLLRLAPAGIDLNFGCPAPTVNRHGGGAALLADPEQLFRIASAVRRAVPREIPFSAKMRLGVSDTSLTLDCARALADGGVVSLVVHARTRAEAYRPPAHWEWVARIREAIAQPVVANGEVWTTADYQRCRAVSGCSDVMLGRGAVADPFLARRIRRMAAGDPVDDDRRTDWQELLPLLASFWQQVCGKVAPQHAPGRLKLWLAALRANFVEADALFLAIRTLRTVAEVDRRLQWHGVVAAAAERRRDAR
jgi:tRNA-dihydrouridine synthase C